LNEESKSLTVKIKYTKDIVEVEGDKMGIDEWVYSTLNSTGLYDDVGIEDIEVEESK
tara:strand:+ start:625 stop:795 length:171 start_codon:yes stop_codon:yes gene_type:complete